MSTELKLEKTCDHRIIREQIYIEDDRKTLRIPRAIVSSVVEFWVNDYKIPKDHPKFGWSLQDDEISIYTKKSKIVLNNKRKSTDDFYFVSYAVDPKYCPKCRSLRVLHDHSYSKLGKVQQVVNEAKLIQEIKKGVYTELGSNPFHTWLGTRIKRLIGSKVSNIDFIKSRIVQEITDYMQKYLEIQLQQSRYQDVTDRESLFQLMKVEAEPLYDIDISYWNVEIIFSNKIGEELAIEKEIQLPGPADLLYNSN